MLPVTGLGLSLFLFVVRCSLRVAVVCRCVRFVVWVLCAVFFVLLLLMAVVVACCLLLLVVVCCLLLVV